MYYLYRLWDWLGRLYHLPRDIIYRLRKGFWRSDLWSLDHTIVAFTLPRLKEFRKDLHGYPMSLSEEDWPHVLDEIIWAFENYNSYNRDEERFNDAIALFGVFFMDLWD